jgi:hypothetical protein
MRRAPAVAVLSAMLVAASRLGAQGVSNVMRPNVPSPTAATLGKFGDVPVSYFTGVPQISIPLFAVKGKTLELPISLAYHASGIKVEEVGGWVGAGWSLEAGGAITRTVRGIVDEQIEGYFNTGRAFYDPQNFSDPVRLAALVRNIHDDKSVDGEPDQFFFNFAGQSGEMVGGPLTTSTNHPIAFAAIPYRRWRIVPEIGPDIFTGMTIIRSWVITTENGTKYTFAAPEVHRDRSYQWRSGYTDSKPYASAWFLTEIRDPGGDAITLEYANYNSEHHLSMYREQATNISEPVPGDCSVPGYVEGASRILDVHSQTYAYAKRLTTIRAAAHTVTFTDSLRTDARSPFDGAFITGRQAQEPRLHAITVQTPAPENSVLRRFHFAYDYSIGGRLTLRHVYAVGRNGDSLPPHSFTYDPTPMPARVTDRTDYHDAGRTASFAMDFWGYYNGQDTNSTLIPPGTSANGNPYPGSNRNSIFSFMKAGALTRITYPTGGFTNFTYAANDFSTGGSTISDPQPRSASAAFTGIGERTTDFTVGGIDDSVRGELVIFIPEICSTQPCPYVQLYKNGSLISTWLRDPDDSATEHIPWTFTRDDYRLKASSEGQNLMAMGITAHWTERVVLPANTKTTGGLRIAEIRTDDGMGTVTARRFSYRLSDGRSSGWLAAEPRFDYDKGPQPGLNGCTYYSRTSMPKVILGGGPLVGYSEVTESLGVNGVFGSIRRTFEPGCDCAEAAVAGNMGRAWPWLRYTTNGWRRGQERSVDEFSAGGRLQRQTVSIYSIPPAPFPQIEFRGLAVDVYSMWGAGGGGVFFTHQFYVRTALKVMTEQAVTLYDTLGANGITTSKRFAFGNVRHAQVTEISETNSGGTQRITRLKYPGDYATGGPPGSEAAALTAMQDTTATGAHMPGLVIEHSVSVKTGTTEQVVQAQVTTFKEFLAGQFLPYRRYVLNSPSPIQ